MSENIDRITDIGIILAAIAVIVLKITGVITISWLWLLSPLWILLGLGVLLAIGLTIACIITTEVEEKRRTKNERY